MTNDVAYLLPFAPVFLALLVLENWISKKRNGRSAYSFADTMSNFGCAVGQNVVGLITTVLLFRLYVWAYENFAITHWEGHSILMWVIAFVLSDFASYWYHWFSHRSRFFWIFHSVHHQSERLNLSTTVRESWFGNFAQVPFFAPLPLLGIPMNVFLASVAFVGIYQIWLHTNLIGKLGWYEKLMNTPSQHRVHHSRRIHELDKNLAASLMVWDHLFGTYQAERERPLYGTVEPLKSSSPVYAQWATLKEMLYLLQRTRGFRNYLRVIFGSPAWIPPGVSVQQHEAEISSTQEIRFDVMVSREMKIYAGFQFLICTTFGVFLMMKYEVLKSSEVVFGVAFVLCSLGVLSGLIEKRRWAMGLEIARNICFVVYLVR